MTIPRYENPTCARPGVDPDSFIFESIVRDDNKQAMTLCIGCPERNVCLRQLLENPRTFEGQVRAGYAVDRKLIGQLTRARASNRVLQTI